MWYVCSLTQLLCYIKSFLPLLPQNANFSTLSPRLDRSSAQGGTSLSRSHLLGPTPRGAVLVGQAIPVAFQKALPASFAPDSCSGSAGLLANTFLFYVKLVVNGIRQGKESGSLNVKYHLTAMSS